jgi:predicted  nucleic acid-binding Zn ribbon protein
MDTAQLLFRTRTTKNDEELLDKVQSYLAALLHNGQIVGDQTPIAKVSGGLLVTASLPEADALADRFANKWVRKRVRELSAVGVDRPRVTHLGTDPESRRPCRCRKRPFLILFTTFLNAEPPLRCGACFGPVALYKVPATNEAGNHQDILWWQDTYQAMHWLFIGTGPGERFAHDQLSRFTASCQLMDESWRANSRRRRASPCTTTSRSISVGAIRPSANASVPRAGRRGCARSLCTGSSTSNASAVGCYQTSRLIVRLA